MGKLFSAKSVLASAVFLLAASAAHADITTYTSQSSYLAAVGTTGVDTFDDLESTGYDGPLTRTAGGYGYTVSAAPNSGEIWGATDDFSDIWLTGGNRLDLVTFAPSAPLAGVGGFFFGSDLFGFSTPAAYLTLSATDSTGSTVSFTLNTPKFNSFVGFVSTGSLVSFSVTAGDQPGVWATVNDLHLSGPAAVTTPVPEPETYGMMLAGLGVLGFIARRKRQRA
ncbi:PEP-CTERM protein-sorting domain-containing protein [Duganella sp. CF517]|uniref:PEP-CTERM sorting domain-containing protein n=1 Tax=Duganella sp. CF517 TaxID=1881038 RepID=UPI0008C97E01|nr:PEP-CTERM sorting domain-containing protein [Duganella sp. CF517]SEO40461.1 PEP-CTERM protein-sorting domain-containing protein [Duganella sp. CF517]